MRLQAIIILSVVAMVTAVPSIRVRRADNSTGVDCGSGSPTGLSGLLAQVGNLLDNILANVAKIHIAGLVGSGALVDLTGVLTQVRILLSTLLGGGTLSDNDTAENRGLLSSLIGQITNLLNNLLGGNTGQQYACNGGGLLGNLLGNLTDGPLGTVLQPVLNLLGTILKALT